MRNRAGAIISIAACLILLAVLVWPYLVRPPAAINTYYSRGVLNPLFAGALVAVLLVVSAAARENYVSPQLGTGIVLTLGLFAFLVTLAWAVTARVDVFWAPNWALPAQRFVLVALSLLVVLGAAWHTWANDLLSLRR